MGFKIKIIYLRKVIIYKEHIEMKRKLKDRDNLTAPKTKFIHKSIWGGSRLHRFRKWNPPHKVCKCFKTMMDKFGLSIEEEDPTKIIEVINLMSPFCNK